MSVLPLCIASPVFFSVLFLETFSYVSQSFCISQFMFYTSWRKTNRSSCFAFLLKFHIDKRDGFANVSKPSLVLQPHVLEKDKSVQLFRFPIEISQNFTSWFCRLLFGKLISDSKECFITFRNTLKSFKIRHLAAF